MKYPSPATIAKVIGFPVRKWPGNCYYVANLLVDYEVVIGELRYGIWLGDINPKSMFAGRSLSRHGWIERSDGIIVDPTRWVFESKKPYIFVGVNQGEYDFGGTTLRKMYAQPCPVFDPDENVFDITSLSTDLKSLIFEVTANKSPKVSLRQLFHLGNLPLDVLGEEAKEMYNWLVRIGGSAYIPIDYRMKILGNIRT